VRGYRFSPEDVEEAVQEVCLRCRLYQQRFKTPPPKSWLFKVADNVCKDMLKRGKEAPIPFSQLADEEGEFDPEEIQDERDWAQWAFRCEVQEALERLSPTYRKVLVWRFIEGLTQKEIAEKLGCQVRSVKVLISKAKQSFKKRWQAG
jgi:RNA polymerase sigma-70 factor (ECF subfamily)